MDTESKFFLVAFFAGLLIDFFYGFTLGSVAAVFLILALMVNVFRRYFIR